MVPNFIGGMMTCLGVAAIALNLILLPLIAFKSGPYIGSYKVLLFLYSLIAVVHTTVMLILVPVFEPSENGWLFHATVQRVPRELGAYLVCLLSTCYMKLLLILTYSFVYRFFVMCSPERLCWFHSSRRIFFLICLYFAILGITAGPVVYYMRLNKDIELNFAKIHNGDLHIELDRISYIGSPIFKDGHFVHETVFILSVWTLVILTSIAICLFCIVNIIRAFGSATRLADESTQFKALQQRLFVLLILQTMVPLLFTFVPVLLSYFLAYLGTHAPFISQTSSALMPLAQVIDPILIFGFIGEYRRAFSNTIRRYILRSIVATTTARDLSKSNSKTTAGVV